METIVQSTWQKSKLIIKGIDHWSTGTIAINPCFLCTKPDIGKGSTSKRGLCRSKQQMGRQAKYNRSCPCDPLIQDQH
jgi:hypothetical protein